jgi:phosphate starvation-inducible PhoH-like protein
MATSRKQKIPAYQQAEFEERISKRTVKSLENRLNGLEENNKNVLNRIVGDLPKIKFKNKRQEEFYFTIVEKEFTICKGSAGTGKTFLAAHAALKLLADPNNNYEKIMIVKSVTSMPGEEIGYIKGSADEKLDPYMSSFTNAFTKFMTKHQYKSLQENEVIEEVGLFQIRGWDIEKTIVIIDEAQNLTHHVMKTAMTRIGYNSKLIILGDSKQVDLKRRSDSCLSFIFEKFKEYSQFGVCEFGLEDVVRNPVIQLIEKVFEEREAELESKKTKRQP